MKQDDPHPFCNCLVYSANALARELSKLSDEAFAATGLTSSYAYLMMTVNSSPGINPKQIAEVMMLSQSTVTRLLEKLERQSLLERKAAGKYTRVFPTTKGQALDKPIRKAWGQVYNKYTQLLGSEKKSKTLSEQVYTAVQRLKSS